ncbi:MAG: nucleotide disphospho-sugar-binding domain-containing protein [Tepidisphaeraceae bacterium]|jgi:UDP:flavonoid glycosyltransferase YjiC (YdhE family)
MPCRKNIVIGTIGSLGDLHPCLALGQELLQRGCRVTIATTPYYKSKVEGAGLCFRAMRPDWNPTDPKLISTCEDLQRGLEVLYREMLLPPLEETYRDLMAATEDADLFIAGELVYAAPLVAEKSGLPWVSLILSPFSFFSCIDPTFTPNLPNLFKLRRAGPVVYKAALGLGKLTVRHWSDPIRQLRRKEGLRRKCDPVFKDKFSPHLVLAMFSRWFAPKQRDWPAQTLQPGFLFQGNSPDIAALRRLNEFITAGTPLLVFTQGSTAVCNPGDFYDISAKAAKRLGVRALLIGTSATFEKDTNDMLALPYFPYSHVFPKASVIIHQGGSGTTGEALRAGRPMLVVPYGWDQPDNAYRIERLGAGLHLPRSRYTVETATAALRQLLDNPRFAATSSELASHIKSEDAVGSGCDAIESVLGRSPLPSSGYSRTSTYFRRDSEEGKRRGHS